MPTAGIPALDQIAKAGWIIIASDYSFAEKGGPHPYMIGEGEARAALDSVRAARQMPELSLDPRTAVWVHSQGGHAALWTGIVGPRYAPDVQIVGVAAIAPGANMANILGANPAADKRLGPYVARSYSRFYPTSLSIRPCVQRRSTPRADRRLVRISAVRGPEKNSGTHRDVRRSGLDD